MACPIAFIHKTRDPNVANAVVANRVVGDVVGRLCILADDMIDTGGSVVKAADLLYEAGAADVIIAATHGIFSEPAADRLKNSRVREVIITNTLPLRPEQRFDKLTVLSIAPMIARAIKEVFSGRLGHQPVRRPQLASEGRAELLLHAWLEGWRFRSGGRASTYRLRRRTCQLGMDRANSVMDRAISGMDGASSGMGQRWGGVLV